MNVAKLVVAGQEMDLKKGLSFGLNYSIDDVRKIEKKNSNYSKTITLAGSRVVDKLMGGLFDVNADFTFFNPNIKTDAKIIVNSATVIEGALQLKSIDKVNIDNTNNFSVEYKCTIVSKTIDFMTDIKDKLLTDLDLSFYDHDYTRANIESSWNNTEGYVYPLFWKRVNGGSNNYLLEDFKPAIFYKTYIKKIVEEAGYTITGSLMDNTTEEGKSFEKEIIPYSGKLPLITQAEYNRRKFQASPTTDFEFSNGVLDASFQSQTNSQTITETGDLEIYNDDSTGSNFDNGGVWDVSNSKYTIDVKGSYGLTFKVNTKVTFSTSSTEAFQSSYTVPFGYSTPFSLTPNNNPTRFDIIYQLTKNGYPFGNTVTKQFTTPLGSGTGSAFNAGNSYTVSNTQLATLSFPSINLSAGDVIGITYKINSTKYGTLSHYLTTYQTGTVITNLTKVPVNWSIESLASDSIIFNEANASALTQGDDIFVNSFIPAKIKQTDLINDLVKRYNAYLSVNPDNEFNIILDTRDTYYNGGEVLDWTNLRDKGGREEIKLLSELQNKELLFTYKKGGDFLSESYFDSTEQIYGEKKISFVNDFAKGEKKIESFFNSTVLTTNATNLPAAVVSVWDTNVELNKGFAVMYYDGLIPTIDGRQWAMIYDSGGVTTSTGYTNYPYAGHLDNPFTPNLDLNFGTAAFFGYTLQENTTDATLYNRYWKNYVNQIDDGKLVTMNFNLNEVIIDKIRKSLNKKIWVEDSFYFINSIIDYDPIINGLTRVELLKIKDGVPFTGKTTSKTYPNGDSNDQLGLLSIIDNGGESIPKNTDNTENSLVAGEGNYIGTGSEGSIIQGDNNTILDGVRGGFIIGSNDKVVSQDNEGWIGETHYVDGVIQTDDYSLDLDELLTLRDNGGLVTDVEYFAKDYKYYFRALSPNTLDTNGRRSLQVVNSEYYSLHGVFDENNSYLDSEKSIWGGKVWVCLVSGTSTPTDYLTLDGTKWEVSTNQSDYEIKTFDIKFSDSLNSITEQSDDKGNKVFYSDGTGITGFSSGDGFEFSDWNDPNIINNNCSIFINNIATSIENNNCFGIVNNFVNNDIKRNTTNGNIAYNNVTSGNTMKIENNQNNGDIHYNEAIETVEISDNENNGNIGASPSTEREEDVTGTILNL